MCGKTGPSTIIITNNKTGEKQVFECSIIQTRMEKSQERIWTLDNKGSVEHIPSSTIVTLEFQLFKNLTTQQPVETEKEEEML